MKAGWKNLAGLAIAYVLLFVVFSVLMPESFPTWGNATTLLRQIVIVAMAALGMTYVIVSGGIDLSVGSVAAFSGVVVAWLVLRGVDPLLAACGGLGVGFLTGLLNGLVITKLKVGPFIVTLGTLLVFRGLAKGLSGEQTVYPERSTWIKELLATLPAERSWMLFPPGVWLTLILAALMAWILRSTRFGRHTVAVGSNESAAQLCGVPVERTQTLVFGLSGLFAGFAGLMLFSRLSVGDPTAAQGLELDAIAAVVIGGASLSGGSGSIAGTLLGALIMGTIRAGGSQYGLANWVQEVLTGSIIVLAVALDRLRVGRRT